MADVNTNNDKKIDNMILEYEDKLKKLLKNAEKALSEHGFADAADNAKKLILDKTEQSREAIKNNPFKAVLISAGVSILLGYLLGKIN